MVISFRSILVLLAQKETSCNTSHLRPVVEWHRASVQNHVYLHANHFYNLLICYLLSIAFIVMMRKQIKVFNPHCMHQCCDWPKPWIGRSSCCLVTKCDFYYSSSSLAVELGKPE